jgi:thiol-disulfide isomerase/thioredoxin
MTAKERIRTVAGCSAILTLVATFFFSPAAKGQAAPSLPGCEPAPAVRKIIEDQLDPDRLDRMKYADRLVYEHEVLEKLIAKYPRELVPYERLRDFLLQNAPNEYEELRDRWIKLAKDHPEDPLALLLAGEALWGRDTAESIRLFEKPKASTPDFPWPARELAGIYAGGKHADAANFKENLEAFFSACPTSSDSFSLWLLNKDTHLQQKVLAATAQSLRARLDKETNPEQLLDYRKLWSLEFRGRPPSEYDALRLQVAHDVQRLERIRPPGDAKWQALIIHGYKQSGASKEIIGAKEDRLLREYPHSNQAYAIVSDRWYKDHKEPEDPNDVSAWDHHQKQYEQAAKLWMHDYPDETYVQRYLWFSTVRDDETVSKEDGIAALDLFVQATKDYMPYSTEAYFPTAAQFLIDRGWEPARALELLKQARAILAEDRVRNKNSDNLTEDQLKETERWQTEQDLFLNGLMLRAALQAKLPEEALKLKVSIETAPPEEKKLQSQYWWNRALLEQMQNHAQDALAYYQLALQTRIDVPKTRNGRLRDVLTDEAHALWQAQGGTEEAWTVWSKPPITETPQLAEGRWEKPTKAIPSFELSDLSGKTWRLKELSGKIVLINVWATWCGPCQAELPHLQEFYEKVKNRPDIQVLTFNIDEDVGLVSPYLKEKGYTFPVLPAFSGGVLEDFGVPQNWVVDPHGIWRWKQFGYADESYADFEKQMLDRLESAKTAL